MQKKEPDPDLVYVNGIDFDTGDYSFQPRSIEAIAKRVGEKPGIKQFSVERAEHPQTYSIPFGIDLGRLEDVGWGLILHENTPQDIRAALEPLIAHRKRQTSIVKIADYRTGEQTRSWYQRYGISPGNVNPDAMPFYLLLAGGPDLIPFEFQYLLNVDFAVGRLPFETADEYERYVGTVLRYESEDAISNAKQIAYWGTRHDGDPATDLSATQLIDPLANGLPLATSRLKKPIHLEVGYTMSLDVGANATKQALLRILHAARPPAVLFTASHGTQLKSGHVQQAALQGSLLCQDWTNGPVKPDVLLAAEDVSDDVNVRGMIFFVFACFAAGTPEIDQFLMDLAQAGHAPPLAPKSFTSALPRRLLTHPKGSALAFVGHVDRAWGFSIRSTRIAEPQIMPFRDALGFILNGSPVGMPISGSFAARYAALSAFLLNATSPTAPAVLSDRELVCAWLERNDAQNYVLFGDPAVRVRKRSLV